MRRLHPAPIDNVTAADAYGEPRPAGVSVPFVRLNMIASVDGAAAVAGRSGALGGPWDKAVFAALRGLADVIVVGAGTMRTEGYGPARLDVAVRARRRGRGQRPVPPVAVVSRSCRLDWRSPFFTEAEEAPLVVTVAAAAREQRAQAAAVAEVVIAGEDLVKADRLLAALAQRGFAHVLLEGGPTLNATFSSQGLIDEMCVTVAPLPVGTDVSRIVAGVDGAAPCGLELVHVLEADGYLFLRYRRR